MVEFKGFLNFRVVLGVGRREKLIFCFGMCWIWEEIVKLKGLVDSEISLRLIKERRRYDIMSYLILIIFEDIGMYKFDWGNSYEAVLLSFVFRKGFVFSCKDCG